MRKQQHNETLHNAIEAVSVTVTIGKLFQYFKKKVVSIIPSSNFFFTRFLIRFITVASSENVMGLNM